LTPKTGDMKPDSWSQTNHAHISRRIPYPDYRSVPARYGVLWICNVTTAMAWPKYLRHQYVSEATVL
jgi:hypothetical protein